MHPALENIDAFIAQLKERATAMEHEGFVTTTRYLEEAAWRLEELAKLQNASA